MARLGAWTWLLPSALLVLEILALQARFSTARFEAIDARWATLVVALREIPRVALLAFTAAWVLGRGKLLADFQNLRAAATTQSQRCAWLAIQVGSFALVWASSAWLLERDPEAGPPPAEVLVGWPLMALVSALFAARATAPFSAWRELMQRRGKLLAGAAGVGGLAWVAGTWSQDELREVLRLPTLKVAYALLYPFAEGAFIDPAAFQFGARNFRVDLAPGCSGLDGIGLVGTFVAAWLVWMRADLRFPRALLLLPLAVALSWILNAARLAMLALIGEHASGSAAIAGFHSVAGLVLFCVTAIGIVALGHGTRFQRQPSVGSAPLFDAPASYLLPLLGWIGIGLLATAFPLGPASIAALRILAVALLLFAGRRHLGALLERPTLSGVVVSCACVAFGLLLPTSLQAGVMGGAHIEGPGGRALGLLSTVAITPLVEELAFRGYLMRRLRSVHFERVRPRDSGALGIGLSAALFGLFHPAWHVGILFGLSYAAAYVWRGRLADAFLAHAASNLALALVL